MAHTVLMLAALSVVSWISFAWAISRHFARPPKTSWLMVSVAVLGALFGLMQVAAMVSLPTPSMPLRIGAAVLYGSALALFWWAIQTTRAHRFHLAFTPSNPTIVLAEGPYRWIRHPFYASYLLYWIAGVCATKAWWMISSVLVMGGLYWCAAVQEEREFLQGGQAQVYDAYIGQTGRFFPKLFRG